MQRRKKPITPKLPCLRGYRIRSQMEGQDWMRNETQTLWVVEPALPDEWEKIKKNPMTIKATLFRSGKRFATYERPMSPVVGAGLSDAPPGTHYI